MAKYTNLTKDELLSICEERSLGDMSGLKKSEIISRLNTADELDMQKNEEIEAELQNLAAQPGISDYEDEDEADEPEPEEEALDKTDENEEKADSESENSDEDSSSEENASSANNINEDIPPEEDNKNSLKVGSIPKAEAEVLEDSVTTAKDVKRRRRPAHLFNNSRAPLTIDPDERFVKKDHLKEDEELMLSYGNNSRYELTGEVIGISKPKKVTLRRENGQTDDTRTVIYATVKYHRRKVLILSEFFFPDADSLDEEYLQVYMQRRIGSTVDFTVIAFDKVNGEPIYYGSRIDAMRINRRRFWYGRTNTKDRKYVIEEGKIIEGRVLAVMTRSIIVEAFGAETRIPISELRYEYTPDARDIFTPGEKVMMRVTDIERFPETASGRGNYDVNYQASIKAAAEDPRKLHYFEYEEGQQVKGTVTRKFISDNSSNGGLRFFVNVNGDIDVYAWLGANVVRIPDEGDEVIVYLVKGYDDSMRFTGRIVYVL